MNCHRVTWAIAWLAVLWLGIERPAAAQRRPPSLSSGGDSEASWDVAARDRLRETLERLPVAQMHAVQAALRASAQVEQAREALEQRLSGATTTERFYIKNTLIRLQRSHANFLHECGPHDELDGRVAKLKDRLKTAEEFGASQADVERIKKELESAVSQSSADYSRAAETAPFLTIAVSAARQVAQSANAGQSAGDHPRSARDGAASRREGWGGRRGGGRRGMVSSSRSRTAGTAAPAMLERSIEIKELTITGPTASQSETPWLVLHDTQSDLVWHLLEYPEADQRIVNEKITVILSDPNGVETLQRRLPIQSWHVPDVSEVQDLLSRYKPMYSEGYLIQYLRTPIVCLGATGRGGCWVVHKSLSDDVPSRAIGRSGLPDEFYRVKTSQLASGTLVEPMVKHTVWLCAKSSELRCTDGRSEVALASIAPNAARNSSVPPSPASTRGSWRGR